jgi:hypothetical protein
MTPGYGPGRISTKSPPLSVAEAMSRSGFYPGSLPVSVLTPRPARA